MAWAIVVTHRCQVLDDFNCLSVVKPPHNTILTQFNIRCTSLYDELMSYSVLVQLRRASLLGVSERSDERSHPGAVHGQQHHVFASELRSEFHADYVHATPDPRAVDDGANIVDEPYQQRRTSSRRRERHFNRKLPSAIGEAANILTRVESPVRLDPAGLEWLAATCKCLAAEMTDAAPASTVGPACQATSRAVAIVHANVAATRVLLRDRMIATAAKLSASASAYVAEDDSSAAEISAVGGTLET